ncbi:MAG: histidinol dehydrogenase, partial [Methanoregulaceae archaeon]|nr:histidinol dehydrogenase [Methanoregulaceae archaeon]
HLSIQVADPMPVLTRVRNAGSIFVGPYSPVACGDYSAGTNHVLPTAGYATTYSGLDVHHFCKRSPVQMIDREGLESIADITELIAGAEGQHAHAKSVHIRRKRKESIEFPLFLQGHPFITGLPCGRHAHHPQTGDDNRTV